ncbi:retrovirus-related pol polyprotein from transposon TNT 1-94 [Tanacetum coccineum]
MIKFLHVFGSPMFIHNHKDHLGKFDAKIDDGYFLKYSLISKDFRVFNTMTQQSEETFHVTFDESLEVIRFSNTSVEEIKINDSSKYLLDEYLQENDPSRHYQVNSDTSYYIIPHKRHKPTISEIIDAQNVLENRWSKEQHIELVNIIVKPTKGMLIKSIASKLTVGLASKCLFADFLSHIEPKTVSKALEEHGLESIRIFLAYATYMNLNVLQMDVKSIFMNGKLKEEVYVQQPPSLESSEFLDYVCKLDKSLYGLNQASNVWYETLATFLIKTSLLEERLTTPCSSTKPK